MTPPRQAERGELSVDLLERAAQTLKLLAHPVRLRIVDLLEGRSGGLPVHGITERVGLGQAATSQHLNQMRRMGLVRAVRHGREVWYEIADETALTVLGCIRRKGGGR